MEELGGKYFYDLFSRSVFQSSSNGESRFIMHDLMNDLAQWVAGKTCFRLEEESSRVEEKARHSSYVRGEFDCIKKFQPFHKITCLRTFLPLAKQDTYGYGRNGYLTSNVLFELLPKLRYLRVLSFSHCNISEVPDSVGLLKHLRYLNLSHTKIKTLPELITSLKNLQTLLLRGCQRLKTLPSEMGNLINPRHLDIANVDLPFVYSTGADIVALKDLKFLRGSLRISELGNVVDALQAREAELIDKKELDALSLEWECDDTRNEINRLDEDVLESLQPHRKLEKLSIIGYTGTKFPSWVVQKGGCRYLVDLRSLSSVRLSGIENLTSPNDQCMEQLKRTKDLTVQGFHFGSSMGDIPQWVFNKCPQRTSVVAAGEDGKLLQWLNGSELEFLELRGCINLKTLAKWLHSIKSLRNQRPSFASCIVSFLQANYSLSKLRVIRIENCYDLTSLPDAMIYKSTCLEELKIESCRSLKSLVRGQLPPTLKRLVVDSCPELRSLSPGGNLPARLQHLEIVDCF
ncbi:putative disease resistance RPP13-like protein 1 [Hevea brasiliensis]|uniref:putative disease resistance RPP13-like protein 1 n=1 Tax=Hevea brasiliensis TaxID=3981 RepID=UPI0025F9542B|nr:putative disease resistance RPP13-like protein 1 [Hevea brasiliensis]